MRTLTLLAAASIFATAPGAASDSGPERVPIVGYEGNVMEPYVSPHGDVLLFNTRNAPGDHTQLRWAQRSLSGPFAYRGAIDGTQSPALTAVPSLDDANELFFISPRDYQRTLSTIYMSSFKNGTASDVRLVTGLAAPRRGIVYFDADISRDGQRLLVSQGTFDATGGPHAATLFLARRNGDAFAIDPASTQTFAGVNAGGLNYAGTMTSDQLTLYFTRDVPPAQPQIWMSHRTTPHEPFAAPQQLLGLGDYVEAPALSPNERRLYYHRLVGKGRFALFSIAFATASIATGAR